MRAVFHNGVRRRILPRAALLGKREQGMDFAGATNVRVNLRPALGSFWLYADWGRTRNVINGIEDPRGC